MYLCNQNKQKKRILTFKNDNRMKKYLMFAAAAAMVFTSCSKTDDVSMTRAEIDKSHYDKIFNQYIEGRSIASNQTWGFSTGAYSRAAGITRAVPGITFPTFRDNSCPSMPTKYKNTLAEAITAGAKYAKDHQNYQNGDIIYINTDYQQLNNPQNYSDLTIYVDGNVTYNGQTNQNGNGTTICVTKGSTLKLGQVSGNLTVYLAPNATLDVTQALKWDGTPDTDWQGNPSPLTFTNNAALYMSAGSTVKGTNIYFKDGYTVLNEGGTIETGDLHVENGAILYNKNKVKATGVIALRNTNGEIDNFGTMEGASMTLDANARFYNVAGGTVTISGLTKLNNNSGNNAWMNGGKFNTGSFEITGGCGEATAFNNCHMTVNGQFYMNHGYFVLDGGAAVECASFRWDDDNYFDMGDKALLKVTGQLIANNDDTGYGFYGRGNEYAVIQAGSIVKESEGKFRAAYFGNLFIDTNDHFAQGRSSADGTWYTWNDPVKFSFTDNNDEGAQKATNFSIDIPADAEGCTPGYHWGDNTPTADIRIIAEDLSAEGASDFDFNDIVLDVKYGNPARVWLVAAGGTLPLRINDNENWETHKLFGVGTNEMVNTGAGPILPIVEITGFNESINSPEEANTKIKLTVYKNGVWQELTAERAEAACKLAVDQTFQILDERQSIKVACPLFLDWVSNENFAAKWWPVD